MLNEEKIVLAHLKRELYERKVKAGSDRLLYPEDVLTIIANIESNIVLGWPDDDLPFSEVTE